MNAKVTAMPIGSRLDRLEEGDVQRGKRDAVGGDGQPRPPVAPQQARTDDDEDDHGPKREAQRGGAGGAELVEEIVRDRGGDLDACRWSPGSSPRPRPLSGSPEPGCGRSATTGDGALTCSLFGRVVGAVAASRVRPIAAAEARDAHVLELMPAGRIAVRIVSIAAGPVVTAPCRSAGPRRVGAFRTRLSPVVSGSNVGCKFLNVEFPGKHRLLATGTTPSAAWQATATSYSHVVSLSSSATGFSIAPQEVGVGTKDQAEPMLPIRNPRSGRGLRQCTERAIGLIHSQP